MHQRHGRAALHRPALAARAADELVAIYGELAAHGANVLDDALAGKPPVVRRKYPWRGARHPSGADYYFHAHGGMAGEYGHVHLFLRPAGMPAIITPVIPPRRLRKTQGKGEAHLVAISIDRRGLPIGLFTTPWLVYPAADVSTMLEAFARGLPPTSLMNRWLVAIVRLFRAQIEDVVRRRDVALARWRRRHPALDPALHVQVVTRRRISLESQIRAVRRRRAASER